ncbi:serine hydrolase domain-containing protein [Streptomyces sp. NBC_00539]|uniref:serine hydrolase domain-containing protein n=1 Tax=Streptomyces sp. NBC_00539 TaxID=2975770 RepID=UPI002E803DC3|nr:serine hydrolase domain-containing protein [Streptomyces sp. NBC_00539]WUC62890.1 beta-lactamase family protein [Streptomyces sp. NBC_00539]
MGVVARRMVAAVAVGVVALGVVGQPVAIAAGRPDGVQQGLDGLVREGGVPGALASVSDGEGRTRTYTAGVGDLASGAAVPRDGQVRIGSNTKVFTAVVVLQLVGEGRLGLDDTVEEYLPGVVRGDGFDGRTVTVRQLLQHTSGIPDYEAEVEEAITQGRYMEPRELLEIAFKHGATSRDGKTFHYSNTNYVLAGLIVEKVARRPLAEEIGRRVVQRLGLRHTYFPAPRDRTIREAHPRAYHQEGAGGRLRDVTEIDPSAAWAAGQMVSTNSDMNRFFTALLEGWLLRAAQQEAMLTTVPIGDSGAGYGLGLMRRPLSCGGVYWGHGGDITGFETRGGVTSEGRAVSIAVTTDPADYAVTQRLEGLVDQVLCR